MTTLSVRLPESLHRNAKLFAEREVTSLNQLLATALAEVPDTAAEPGDQWP